MREMQFKIQEMIFVTFLVLINHEVKMHIKHFFNKTNKKNTILKKGNKHNFETTVKQNTQQKYGSGLSEQRATTQNQCNWIHSKIGFIMKDMPNLLK